MKIKKINKIKIQLKKIIIKIFKNNMNKIKN